MSSAGWGSLLALFAAAGGGGAVFAVWGVPLAWILGAMAGAAVYTNLFGPVRNTRLARRSGQLILGTSAAAVLTAEILAAMAGLLPVMFGAALLAILVGVAAARPFAVIARVDRTTAILSALPAGLAEMASLAQDRGARSDIVTVTHTLRVFAVVTIVPFVLAAFAAPALPQEGQLAPDALGWLSILACLGLSAAISLLAGRFGMINPWIVVPMVVGAGLAVVDLPVARMPQLPLVGAQILIGGSLGAQLLLTEFARLPRVLVGASLSTAMLVLVMLVLGVPFLALTLGLDPLSLALALSPGGFGEMVASAKALDVQVAVVVGFQFVRSLLTNLAAPFLVGRDCRGMSEP
ncbi:AbrB family transcriptional regulator [Rubellimicrobium roseum]|uniref:AbrB family transcriptional regulator n=1 Tax=Rubellimicrobium roseum TaxID=687525 RepID=A0A5C4N9T1_9RHOB|nr:AbrB family transcriptional regulator [Rubellimicrobium roseum]TNC63598.1 AbrB family transcriptional regulator [Rubellimicrobium roseum]